MSEPTTDDRSAEERLAEAAGVDWDPETKEYRAVSPDGPPVVLSEMEVMARVPLVAWDLEAFIAKPEAEALTPEEVAAMTPEERAALEAGAVLDWDAHVRRAHEAFQEDSSKRPLPRHRPPTFKDPGKTVAPRLPKDVFGAPRATR